jgi:hypothetical protein
MNHEVLREVPGSSDAELKSLELHEIIGTVARPLRPRKKQRRRMPRNNPGVIASEAKQSSSGTFNALDWIVWP